MQKELVKRRNFGGAGRGVDGAQMQQNPIKKKTEEDKKKSQDIQGFYQGLL